jgi:outer membrane protein TolC
MNLKNASKIHMAIFFDILECNFMRFFIALGLVLTSGLSSLKSAELKLTDYLEQVQSAHLGLQASRLKVQGYQEEASERQLMLWPNLIGQARLLSDSRQTGSPDLMGTKTTAKTFSLGISELTPIGLRGQISYDLTSTHLEGANPTFVSVSDFTEGRPSLQITQSLWRNFFGSETRAQVRMLEAKALASSFSETFKLKQILAEAETVFWKAYLSKRILELRKETRDRAQQLKVWAARRVDLHLADDSDLLQAEAALRGRQLELHLAEDNQKEVARIFNSLRQQDSDLIYEELVGYEMKDFLALKVPAKSERRDDTKASEQLAHLTRSSAQLTYERAQPTVEVSASAALNARETTYGSAIGNSFNSKHPTYTIALSLNAPLGLGYAKDLRAGAEKEQLAAELDFKRKVFEEEQEWKSLEQKFTSAKERLLSTRELEESQLKKAKHERERLTKGRSTTFQVLLFEEDYSNAKLNRLQTEAEILSLHARLKTFR